MEEGARYLQAGIDTMEEGTQEGKFYMHLGDALHRTNRTKEVSSIRPHLDEREVKRIHAHLKRVKLQFFRQCTAH